MKKEKRDIKLTVQIDKQISDALEMKISETLSIDGISLSMSQAVCSALRKGLNLTSEKHSA